MTGQSTIKKKNKVLSIIFYFIISASILCLLIGIFLVGFLPISHSSLKTQAENIFLDMAFDTCAVGSVTMTIYKGISLKDVSLKKQVDNSKSLTCKLPELNIKYNLISTILNWNRCKEVLNNRINKFFYIKATRENRNVVNVNEFKSQIFSSLYEEISGPDTIIFSCIKSIHFNGVGIVIDSLNKNIINFKNIAGSLLTQFDSPKNFTVKISIENGSVLKNTISNFQTTLKVNDINCNASFTSDSIFKGSINGNINLNLQKNLIKNGTVFLNNIDIEKIYSLYKYKHGYINGTGNVQIEFDTCIADFDSLSGRGKVDLLNVSAKDLPVLNQIAQVTMLSGLSHLNFEEIKGEFIFNPEKIESEIISGKGDPLSIDISGWVKPSNEKFSVNLKGTFKSYYKDSIATIVWETMFPENDEGRSFRCKIYGNPESPSISVDKNFATRAINSMIKSLGNEIKSFFK